MLDTSDWPQRFAVYAFDLVDGYDSLSEGDQQTCRDAAEWARQRVAEAAARLQSALLAAEQERDFAKAIAQGIRAANADLRDALAAAESRVRELTETALTPHEAATMMSDYMDEWSEETERVQRRAVAKLRAIAARSSSGGTPTEPTE